MEQTLIDKLAWIYIKDRQILNARSKGKDIYFIPGGKREANESDEQALIREIKEELSVNIAPETIKQVGAFEAQAYGKPEGTLVRMACYSADFSGEIKPAAEIEEVAWFTSRDADKISPVSKLLFSYLKNNNLID